MFGKLHALSIVWKSIIMFCESKFDWAIHTHLGNHISDWQCNRSALPRLETLFYENSWYNSRKYNYFYLGS